MRCTDLNANILPLARARGRERVAITILQLVPAKTNVNIIAQTNVIMIAQTNVNIIVQTNVNIIAQHMNIII